MIPLYSSGPAQLLGFSATLAAVAALVPKIRLAHAHAASVFVEEQQGSSGH